MTRIDAAIVLASLLALVALGDWLASRQRLTGDYYLGGRRLPAWALGISLAANQVSAISLVCAPAFVALLWGGTLVVTVVLAVRLGAEGALFRGLDAARLDPLDLVHTGLGDGATFAFWPMLVGGLFLLVLAWLAPSLSWLWWNVSGFGVTLAVGAIGGRRRAHGAPPLPDEPGWRRHAIRLLVLSATILAALVAVRITARLP